jgi:hypothetical protein
VSLNHHLLKFTMNSSLRLFGSLVGLGLFSPPLRAQTSLAEGGLIGKPYAGFDFTYDRYSGSQIDKALGILTVANVPVSPHVDVGLSYQYSDATGPFDGPTDHVLSASVLTFNRTAEGKAYFSATLGHAWRQNNFQNLGTHDNGAYWAVRAGYEIPLGETSAANLGLGYADGLGGGNYRDATLQYHLEINHWFTPTYAGVLGGHYSQVARAPDFVSYTLGFRWHF